MDSMKTMGVGEFKSNFSEVLKLVIAGENIGIIYGRKKEVVAMIVPNHGDKKLQRVLGILDGKVKVEFGNNFKIDENEFLGI